MTIREGIISEALRRASPQDLDDVLTAIEAYRMCAGAAGRLARKDLGCQRNQVRECAERIETALAEFAVTGVLATVRYHEGEGRHLIVSTRWQEPQTTSGEITSEPDAAADSVLGASSSAT
jgi:hypothetical protein